MRWSRMPVLAAVVTAGLLLGVAAVPPAHAGDAMRLVDGQPQILADGAAPCRNPGWEGLLAETTIALRDDGTVTGVGLASFEDLMWTDGNPRKGSARLDLDGSYDRRSGRLTATYLIVVSDTSSRLIYGAEGELLTTIEATTDSRFEGAVEATVAFTDTEATLTFTGAVTLWSDVGFSGDADPGQQVPGSTECALTVTFTVEPRCVEEGADSGARFSNISRVVEVFPDSDPDAIFSAKPQTVLRACDHVVTGEESTATISFADLSTLTMLAESEVVVTASPKAPGRLEILFGRLKLNMSKVIAGEPIEVKSVWATVGIKGTTLVIEVSATETVVKVMDGEVEVTATATGDTRSLAAGQTVTAGGEGLSAVAPFDTAAEASVWEQEAVAPESSSTTTVAPTTGAAPSSDGGGANVIVILIVVVLAIVIGVAAMLRRSRPSDGDAG